MAEVGGAVAAPPAAWRGERRGGAQISASQRPFADVVEQRAGGVGGVGRVDAAAGQLQIR